MENNEIENEDYLDEDFTYPYFPDEYGYNPLKEI